MRAGELDNASPIPDECVVAALIQLGLLPREAALSAAKLALPLLLHPASFLRLGVVGLVCALADNLGGTCSSVACPSTGCVVVAMLYRYGNVYGLCRYGNVLPGISVDHRLLDHAPSPALMQNSMLYARAAGAILELGV